MTIFFTRPPQKPMFQAAGKFDLKNVWRAPPLRKSISAVFFPRNHRVSLFFLNAAEKCDLKKRLGVPLQKRPIIKEEFRTLRRFNPPISSALSQCKKIPNEKI